MVYLHDESRVLNWPYPPARQHGVRMAIWVGSREEEEEEEEAEEEAAAAAAAEVNVLGALEDLSVACPVSMLEHDVVDQND